MRTRVLTLTLAAAITSASSAGAQVIFDQSSGAGSTVGGGLGLSPGWAAANDFTLAGPATIRAVSFFSFECCNSPWNGTLRYFFATPDAGFPFVPEAVPFAEGIATAFNVTTLYSDAATNVNRRYDFNLNAPVVLGAGTYFFGLMAENGPGATFLAWRAGGGGLSANSNDPTRESWILQGSEPAFQLHGSTFAIASTTAPEPATLSLLGGGLAVLGGLALRRRR